MRRARHLPGVDHVPSATLELELEFEFEYVPR